MIVGESTSAPPPDVRRSQIASVGMFCAMASALSLLFAGDYLYFKLPKFNDVYKSIQVRIPQGYEFVYDYGMAAWGLLLIATVVSFDRAIRDPLGRWTLTFNVAVGFAAVGFAFFVFHAAWSPFYNLLQGIGTQQ